MVEVKKKKNESFEGLLRRFNRRVIESGKIFQARKIQFYNGSKSKNAAKASALRRKELRERSEYLRKIGKLKDDSR